MNIDRKLEVLGTLTSDLIGTGAKAIILFGSMARYLLGGTQAPDDIDVIYVGNRRLPDIPVYRGVKVDLLQFSEKEMTGLAYALRHYPRWLVLTDLSIHSDLEFHVRKTIGACLLLGKDYPRFGIEQRMYNSLAGWTDLRDYSVHKVLYGADWWAALQDMVQARHYNDKATRYRPD